jgi:uncharacterized membrane protein YgaE (UPF0421/DUF939 family)
MVCRTGRFDSMTGKRRLSVLLDGSLGRLREGWPFVAEATAAATAAWIIDTRFLGQPRPFFAPAAALIVLGQVRGQRLLRAVEVVLGVAGGVLLADAVAGALGRNTTLTIFIVTALTLTLAVAVGGSAVFIVQSAVSAIYVAVVAPPTSGLIPHRFFDALVGGGVAVVVSQVMVARDPLARLVRQTAATFDELAGILENIASAIDRRDTTMARQALDQARRADNSVADLRSAVSAAREALWFRLDRQRRLDRVQIVDTATRQLDLVQRGIRVLARTGVTVARLPTAPPPEVGAAIRSLATAVEAVKQALNRRVAGASDARPDVDLAELAALEAVRTAGRLVPDVATLPVVSIVGQLRMSAIDLLRGAGRDDIEVLSRVDEALGLPPV